MTDKDRDFRPLYERERATELCSIWEDMENMAEKWEVSWGCTRREVIEAVIYTLVGFTLRRQNERLFQHPQERRQNLEYILQYVNKHLSETLDLDEVEFAKDKYGADLLYLRDANNHGLKSSDCD